MKICSSGRVCPGLLLIFLFVCLIVSAAGSNLSKGPSASRGSIDLTSWNFASGDIVRLDGEWEFYPDSITGPLDPGSSRYVKVPASLSFGSHTFISPDRSCGSGSYRLVVKLPSRCGPTALYIRQIYSSSEILVNGKSLYAAGKPGSSKQSTVPFFKPGIVFIPEDSSGSLEIVCRVANYHYYKGGIISSLYFGSAEGITAYRDKSSRHAFFLFGILFIMAVYHLSLNFLRPKELSSFFFGLACAFYAVRLIFSDAMLVLHAYPRIPWELVVKIQYISYYASLGFFFLFFKDHFPAEVPKRFISVSIAVLALFSAVTAVLPASIYSFYLSKPFELFGLVSLLCIIFFLVRAVKAGREGSLVISAGCLVLLAAVVNDILYTSQLVGTGYLAMSGFLFFIFTQAFALAIKFTNSFYAVEQLSEEIRESKEKLHETITHLAESEKHSTVNTLVAGIAHDVNSPLGIAITAFTYLEDRIKGLAERLQTKSLTEHDLAEYISEFSESAPIIRINLERSTGLMRSFKDLIADQYSEEPRVFNVKEYLGDIVLSLTPKLKKRGHIVSVVCPDDLLIRSYPGAFSQIIINLVLNSVIHGFESVNSGFILMEFTTDGNTVKLRYHDNGGGILPENMPMVFNPFFTTKRGKGGTGLGMHIVNTTVTHTLKGSIRCESAPNEGTTFFIEFPIERI